MATKTELQEKIEEYKKEIKDYKDEIKSLKDEQDRLTDMLFYFEEMFENLKEIHDQAEKQLYGMPNYKSFRNARELLDAIKSEVLAHYPELHPEINSLIWK